MGRVALLGIAQRTVRVEYTANRRNQKRAKALQLNVRTAGDWLKVKRLEKNLTRGHVAAKMGIATSLVCSWESSTRQPDSNQLKILAAVLGFDAKDFYTHPTMP
jgi:DNA-binding transcriptional regulator YiaG